MRLDFVEAGVAGRLGPLDLSIAPGQFIGVAGPSGAGKSTLLKALIGVPGHLEQGRILADGRNPADDPDGFRGRLGYVSQDKAIHEDLTPLQVVSFSAAFRGRPGLDASSLLRQVGLERTRWNARVGELSGGQEKRVRIAAELVNTPGLLVLDEPGSGLDWAREESLARLLKTLSHRGCTVIVVTHNLNRLADFGRVLILRGGQTVFDGPPETLREQTPSGNLAEIDFDRLGTASKQQVQEPGVRSQEERRDGKRGQAKRPRALSINGWLAQAVLLVRREMALIRNRRTEWDLPHVLVPSFAVPLCFATALHMAIKPDDKTMLGFLSVLSCVWMGASLGLMSIVSEREVFDHERLLFLRVGPYVTAKMIVLGTLSVVQTLVFFTALVALRRTPLSDGMLLGGFRPALVLLLVGLAALGLGLVISAAAKRNKPLPNFILPLVMIAQMLFSVQVAGNGKEEFFLAYGEFHAHQCRDRAAHASRRRAERWLAVADETAGLEPGWYCSDCPPKKPSKKPLSPDTDANQDRFRPKLAAALGSYLTISRYGDIALRSFAYFDDDERVFLGESDPNPTGRLPRQVRFGYRRWRVEALGILAALIVGFPAAAAAVLWCQTAPRQGRNRISAYQKTRA
ncbi:MAG TPA: ABC transporter ATP-binding protein [Pirellulales bacterium]|nr:ABC transporter ATP-binding protein [Pirellulales bacterium]